MMKCRMEKAYGPYDTGPDQKLTLKPLMRGFQDAAAEHARMSGVGMDWLLGQKKAWIMHRLCLQIHQMPQMGENLTFITWHKGDKGFKAFRDYTVWSGMRKRVTAASLWLFVDLEKRRLLRVPEESREWYTVEKDNAMETDIEAFKPIPKTACDVVETLTVRSSDYDTLGHVNNAVYLDYLETAVDRRFAGRRKIKEVMIQFHKEISREIRTILVGFTQEAGEPGRFRFTLASEQEIHGFGEFALN